jgi:hypothetical protein
MGSKALFQKNVESWGLALLGRSDEEETPFLFWVVYH